MIGQVMLYPPVSGSHLSLHLTLPFSQLFLMHSRNFGQVILLRLLHHSSTSALIWSVRSKSKLGRLKQPLLVQLRSIVYRPSGSEYLRSLGRATSKHPSRPPGRAGGVKPDARVPEDRIRGSGFRSEGAPPYGKHPAPAEGHADCPIPFVHCNRRDRRPHSRTPVGRRQLP